MQLFGETYNRDPIAFYEADIQLTPSDRTELHHELNKIISKAGFISLACGMVGFSAPRMYSRFISHHPAGMNAPLVSMVLGCTGILGAHAMISNYELQRQVKHQQQLNNQRMVDIWKQLDPDRFEYYSHYFWSTSRDQKLILKDPRLTDSKYAKYVPMEQKINDETKEVEDIKTGSQWDQIRISRGDFIANDKYDDSLGGLSLGTDNVLTSQNGELVNGDKFEDQEDKANMSAWDRIRNSSR